MNKPRKQMHLGLIWDPAGIYGSDTALAITVQTRCGPNVMSRGLTRVTAGVERASCDRQVIGWT